MTEASELKQAALQIFAAGLAAVDPYVAVQRCLRREGEDLVLRPPQGAEWRQRLSHQGRLVVVGGARPPRG